MKSADDITFSEWDSLSFSEKCEICNHHWNPHSPQIGSSIKREIINNFIKHTSFNGLQYGIRSFEWGIYMLFVIVEDAKTRVPKKYSDLLVNKGIVKEWVDKNQVLVKFNYGGSLIINLESNIIIG
ncbi:hypothetical protein [Dysgonomonas capnocytophagoides]|uniref:hypothetical protein n=1 Tax=Dysgonomonas capnocytophagoides TaxID=45254 RepID=UPI00291F48D2|nr:hypothetical protein DCPSUM001_34080 [Dysgonomonas capnocytophagoides]